MDHKVSEAIERESVRAWTCFCTFEDELDFEVTKKDKKIIADYIASYENIKQTTP